MPEPDTTRGVTRRPARRSTARHPSQGLRRARGNRADARGYRLAAERRLRRFRQTSALAVSLAALLLLVWGGPVDGAVQQAAPLPPASDPGVAVDEATNTIRELALGFYAFLPRLVLALVVLGLASVVARVARAVLDRTLQGWERATALAAIVRLVVFVAAAVAAISIVAGDARAVVGSVGLLGLAASWALQTPIESFTGWLLNSFRGYYRVGDRIAVGDVFGDVYRIDVLTTTVWEAGGSGKPVSAAQSTGALITFPNWEVLRSNIVNYSRDFPYVWDEVRVGVANESDLAYCVEVIETTARRVLGEQMKTAVQRYEELLRDARLTFEVDPVPRVYLSTTDSWTDCTVRYLVPVRSRRHWSSTLVLEFSRELARDVHQGRIISVYKRTEVLVRNDWAPKPE